jgi:hypothetical protein
LAAASPARCAVWASFWGLGRWPVDAFRPLDTCWHLLCPLRAVDTACHGLVLIFFEPFYRQFVFGCCWHPFFSCNISNLLFVEKKSSDFYFKY